MYIRWRKKRMKYLWIGQTYIGVEYEAMPQNLHKIMNSWCDILITSYHVLCCIYRIDPIDNVPCIALFQHPPIIRVRTITNTSKEQRLMLWSAGWPFVKLLIEWHIRKCYIRKSKISIYKNRSRTMWSKNRQKEFYLISN